MISGLNCWSYVAVSGVGPGSWWLAVANGNATPAQLIQKNDALIPCGAGWNVAAPLRHQHFNAVSTATRAQELPLALPNSVAGQRAPLILEFQSALLGAWVVAPV